MNSTFSEACERNKEPILKVLKEYLQSEGRLFEIGTGGAQHAEFFSEELPYIQWVCSDLEENHDAITSRLKKAKLKNVHGPYTFKSGRDDFPKGGFDYVFTANTLHIMGWKEVKSLIKLLGKRLRENSLVFIYGPFNYEGKFTSESNAEFDQWLKNRNEKSGIRNFEDILNNFEKVGFKFIHDHPMPANNRMLVFKRLAFKVAE